MEVDGASVHAMAICEGKAERGVLICGGGIGSRIAANRVTAFRIALVHDALTARLAVSTITRTFFASARRRQASRSRRIARRSSLQRRSGRVGTFHASACSATAEARSGPRSITRAQKPVSELTPSQSRHQQALVVGISVLQDV
jgi:hypothetical protein